MIARLKICPVSLAEANAFVAMHHRHHRPLRIHKFSIGCALSGKLVGVAIVARPVSQHLDDGLTLEVARLCTDGTRNTCSLLYAASWRAAQAMGYRKMTTYILESEPGTSLRAAGWRRIGLAGVKGPWTGTRARQRNLLGFDDCTAPRERKVRYEMGSEEDA